MTKWNTDCDEDMTELTFFFFFFARDLLNQAGWNLTAVHDKPPVMAMALLIYDLSSTEVFPLGVSDGQPPCKCVV
jgi:hypothetical protein